MCQASCADMKKEASFFIPDCNCMNFCFLKSSTRECDLDFEYPMPKEWVQKTASRTETCVSRNQ